MFIILNFWFVSATSNYIHEEVVDWVGTITICDPNDSTKCITMKDRNEWATEAWIWCNGNSQEYYCFEGWIGGFENYEECYQTCVDEDWVENDEDCSFECTPDLKWYEDLEWCENAMSEAFEECIMNTSWVYWYHFQRWNNHEFEIWCFTGSCSDNVTNLATTGKATWDASYNKHWYNWPITNFMKWSENYRFKISTFPSDIWWWSGDLIENNRGYYTGNYVVFGRKWPCDTWYHVPSLWERITLSKYWLHQSRSVIVDDRYIYNYNNSWFFNIYNCIAIEWEEDYLCYDNGWNEIDCDSESAYYMICTEDDQTIYLKFQNDFKIPFASYRYYKNATLEDLGRNAYLWTSTPEQKKSDNGVLNLYLRSKAYYLKLGYGLISTDINPIANGFSLRCFKDEPLTFSSNGSSGDSLIVVNIAAFNSWMNTCSGEDYIFSGITAGTTARSYDLSKTFQCAFWDAGQTTVTLQLSGNLTDQNWNSISSSNVKIKNLAWMSTPETLQWPSSEIVEYLPLSEIQTLFNKATYKIWTAEWTWVNIQITVPAWTPDGTYDWTLVLSY